MSEAERDRLRDQYRTSTNLRARVALHARFSTNKTSWYRWLFDHYVLPPGARILEVGCGTGALWHQNRDRLPPFWRVLLTDLSAGMVQESAGLLSDLSGFRFAVADTQAVPTRSAIFDAVIANTILFHLPNVRPALAELHRVLKPGGWFYAAEGGRAHMQELYELLERFETLPERRRREAPIRVGFGLETARDYLAPWFRDAEIHLREDGLVVTEAAPLVAYVYSMSPPWAPAPERRGAFTQFIQMELNRTGAIRMTKATGIITATRV